MPPTILQQPAVGPPAGVQMQNPNGTAPPVAAYVKLQAVNEQAWLSIGMPKSRLFLVLFISIYDTDMLSSQEILPI